MGVAANVDGASDIQGLKSVERVKHALPALFPAAHQFLARRLRMQFKLLVAIAIRLLAVAGQKICPARALISADMFDQQSYIERFRIGRIKEIRILQLRQRSLRQTLVSAKIAPNLVQIRRRYSIFLGHNISNSPLV